MAENAPNGDELSLEQTYRDGDDERSVHVEDPSEFNVTATEQDIAMDGASRALRPLAENRTVPRVWRR